MNLFDQNAAMQVLGCLVKKPLLLAEVDKYKIALYDFYDNKIDKKIFGAIVNLYNNGATELSPIDIDNYLQHYDVDYENFKSNNGVQLLVDINEMANLSNFTYNYNLLKKLSALRLLRSNGFNINSIINIDELDLIKQQQQLDYLERLDVEDIFNIFSNKIMEISDQFVIRSNGQNGSISVGMSELVEQLKLSPEVGFSLQGSYFNTIVRGARQKKLYLLSGSQGSGKSRQMTGHACNLAFPERYDLLKKIWTNTGLDPQKVLFIGTEMDMSEMQTIVLAWISGINEETILYGTYNQEEKVRVEQAIKILDKYKDYFIFEQQADPSIKQIQAIIRKHKIKNNINYVFFDYIFSSRALLDEYRDLKIREDVVLMMMTSTLKDLANELDLFIMTGTQLNGNWQEFKGIRDQNLIRGSKALADKIDVGAISLPVTPDELSKISLTCRTNNILINPTQVTDIYKVRRGRYNHVRVWSATDLGTARVKDLIVTDISYNAISMPEIIDNMSFDNYIEEEKVVTTEVKEEKVVNKDWSNMV